MSLDITRLVVRRVEVQGWPAYVTCAEPFVPVIVLSLLAVTPEPAVALPSSGGQNDRQLPVHVDLEEVSDANMYSVFPEPSVRYVPSGPDRVATVMDDVPPLAALVPPPAAGVVPLPEPPELEHAERSDRRPAPPRLSNPAL